MTGRTSACAGKVRHATKAAALSHMHGLVRDGAVRLRVYRCRYCSKTGQPAVWHVGHPTGSTASR
jgi:lipopolysaccharide biosynthesis regulator YciM